MNITPVYKSRLAKWLGVQAITLYPFIFFRASKYSISPRLFKHEMVHVQQVRTFGFFRFYFNYAWAYLRLRLKGWAHWKAYSAIPYEMEAFRESFRELTVFEKRELGIYRW